MNVSINDVERSTVSPDLSVVILCYKVGSQVREFVRQIQDELQKNKITDYELVLVGNYTTSEICSDVTPKVIIEMAKEHDNVVAVTKPKKGMLGWDVKAGLMASRGNYLAIIDGDGQVPAVSIVNVYNEIKNGAFDIVKTYRIERGDGWRRNILSKCFNYLFFIFFPGLDCVDINSKPKIFNRKTLATSELTSDDWFIDAEIMIRARNNKLRVKEVPIIFSKLVGRQSLVDGKVILEFIYNLLSYRINNYRK